MAIDLKPTSFGRGLQLAGGDFVFAGNELATIAGRDNFLQGMQVMIETPFGSDIFNVNYGFDIVGILSSPQTVGSMKALVRLNIVKSVSQDDRVREIKEVVFDDEDRFFQLAPEQNEEEHRRNRKLDRRWQTLIVLETISEGEAVLRLEGAGLKT
jgi:phage baseplate assembly protein W